MNKVLIVGMPRAGTTYVLHLMSAYLDTMHLSEPIGSVLVDWRASGKDVSEIPQLFKNAVTSIRQYVDDNDKCVIKDHIQNYRSYGKHTGKTYPWEKLYKDFYKIKLFRRDFKALVFSMAISKTTRVFNVANKDELVRSVTIDETFFKQVLIDQWDILQLMYEDKLEYDEVVYFDDFTGDPVEDQKLLAYTRDNIKNIYVPIKKANPHREVISNYDELEKIFNESVTKLHSNIIFIDDGMVKTK